MEKYIGKCMEYRKFILTIFNFSLVSTIFIISLALIRSLLSENDYNSPEPNNEMLESWEITLIIPSIIYNIFLILETFLY
jgi:large-conductance mechanosensitive channel